MKRGFTLIELLISLAIIGVITTLALASFRGIQRREELRLVAETLATDLRRAQTMSLIGARLADGRIARGGYGIFIESNQRYLLFADTPWVGGIGSPPIPNGLRDIGEPVISTINLPAGITMSLGPVFTNNNHIIFAPPRPITCFGGITSAISPIGEPILVCTNTINNILTIHLTRAPQTKRVIINRLADQISIE